MIIHNKSQPSPNRIKTIFGATLPIYIYFIALSIHTILTKANILAVILATMGLITFTAMLTLVTSKYLNARKSKRIRYYKNEQN